LIAILAIYAALATLQSFATRLQWGPDEPGHIIYVESLALDRRFPALTHGEEENAYLPGAARTHESHQPPLYYAAAAIVWSAFAHLPPQTVAFIDQTGAQQRFDVPGAVRPVRLLSVVFGALALALMWATARAAFPGRPHLWLGGLALVAFTPMFTYVSGVINNDSLLTVAFSAAALLWARIIRHGSSTRDILLLGLALGLAMNAKETAVALVPVSVLVLAVAPGAASWPKRITSMCEVIGIAAALSVWWLVRKWLIYGSPLVYPYLYPMLGLPPDQRSMLVQALPERIFLFTFLPADVVQRHTDLALISRFLLAVVVLSAGGLLLLLLRRKRVTLPPYEGVILASWLLLALVVLLGLIRNILTVDWRMGTSGGRYLVCALPLLGLVAARGLSALFGEGRWARVGIALLAVATLALNILTVWATAAEYGTL
jgi:4-amino-4-deoxy-L-arabinose transferase-like glycosyltransferase